MMSRRDAIRSYRRSFRRWCNSHDPSERVYGKPRGPLHTEMCARGTRLQNVYARHKPVELWPVEVVDAMEVRSMRALEQDDSDDDIGF